MTRTRNSSSERTNKPPSLLDISPLQINHPRHKNAESHVKCKLSPAASTSKNNNIPSLLSLNLQSQDQTEPVSLFSLNFASGQRQSLASHHPIQNTSLDGIRVGEMSTSSARNRNNRIPSLFECEVRSKSKTLTSSKLSPTKHVGSNPIRHTSALRNPIQFGNNASPSTRFPISPTHTKTSVTNPQVNFIPSLLSPELAWMGHEPPDRFSKVLRTTVDPHRARRKHF